MPKIKPIPRKLLIHTVTYEKSLGSGGFTGEETYDDPITIERVRVQYSTALSDSGNAKNIEYKAILFFDMTHSTPLVDFVKGSRIKINDDTLYIQEVDPVHDFKLHHYELVLN